MSAGRAVVNHHAGAGGCSGFPGLLVGLGMAVLSGRNARLVVDLADVSAADRVVDVGCGPGNAAREAARQGAQVTGVDPSTEMLRIARATTRDRLDVTWLPGSAEHVPLPDSSATVLWTVASVHHWADVAAGLAEAGRVLEPGGRFLAFERRVRPGATGLGSHGWTAEQVDAFAALCTAAGFTDVRTEEHPLGRRSIAVVRAIRRLG